MACVILHNSLIMRSHSLFYIQRYFSLLRGVFCRGVEGYNVNLFTVDEGIVALEINCYKLNHCLYHSRNQSVSVPS